jgi:hypothetical protein
MENDHGSPVAKNQKLDISSDGKFASDESVSEQKDVAVPGPIANDTSGNGQNLSESQVDGQSDAEVKQDVPEHVEDGPSSVVLESPKASIPEKTEEAKPETTEEAKPETVVPEKSKIPEASAVDAARERNSIYHVKWIGWRRSSNDALRRVGVITQNENGPCPLLSIINVLLLRGRLTLPEGCEVISAEQLLEFLGKKKLPGIILFLFSPQLLIIGYLGNL